MRSRPLLAGACAALLACAAQVEESAPRLSAVVPAQGYASRASEVVIRGEGFQVDPYQEASGAPRVDATFRAWLGATELADVRWVNAGELHARVPAGLAPGVHRLEVADPRGARGALPAAFTAVAGAPPALVVTASLRPAVASLGQPVLLTIEVANHGGTEALGVVPEAAVAGEALALAAPLAGAVTLPPGAAHAFDVVATAGALGAAAVTAAAAATDPVTGAVLRADPVAAGAVFVQPPSTLAVSASVAPSVASVGQLVVVEAAFSNAAGAAPVAGLAAGLSGEVGAGAIAVVASPPPCDVASGGTCTATFLLRAAAPGPVELHLDATGADANSGAAVAAPHATASLRVERPPALAATLAASPVRASVGQPLALVLAIGNGGEAAALGVEAEVTAAPLGSELVGPPPPPQDIPAGATRTFAWTVLPREPGAGAFVAAAVGEDANGAGPVSVGSTLSNEVVVDSPAALVAIASAAPARVTAGQTVAVVLDVTNLGEASAAVTPSLAATAAGTAAWSAGPAGAATVPGGATVRFTWSVVTSGSGTLTFTPAVAGVDANSGAPVAVAADAGPVRVEAPAALAVALDAPDVVNEGQTFAVAVAVANNGEAAASGVVPGLTPIGPAGYASGPLPPPPVELAGGATQRFEWSYVAGEGPAAVQLDAAASASDGNAGTPLSASSPRRSVTVQRPPELAAAFVAAPDRVNTGGLFTVRVRVSNSGDDAALGVVPAVACDACIAASVPVPAAVAADASAEWDLVFGAGAPGAQTIRASASGTGATDAVVRSSPEAQRPLSIERPAALTAAFREPGFVAMAGFVVEVEVANPRLDPADGQATASEVAPGPLAVVAEPGFLAPAQVTCAPRSTAATEVAAGARAVFAWTCAAAAVGQVKLSVEATGTDANDGAALSAAAVGVLQVEEAAKVLDDPFGDASPFSFVFGYDGHVFLGPSGDGRGLVRCEPDGTGCASFALSFHRDVTSAVASPPTVTSVHQNTCPEYVTIGSSAPLGSPAWCDPDNPAATPCNCGPHYEAGRGLFSSFSIAGDEWLVAMGRSKKRELRYLYMTRETATPLRFSYVDVTAANPSLALAVEDVTAMAVLDGRLYVGLQVDGAERPRLLVLSRTPVAPGLDATAPADVASGTFRNTVMGEVGNRIAQVDALLGFEGRLFVANRRAVLLSTTGAPDLEADPSTQFRDCTPLPPATWAAAGFDPPEKVDITPADKVVPALAAWQGRLYLVRNTAAGVPELWVFTPRHDAAGSFLGCAADRTDWTRIATSFGDAGNVRATALLATATHLYVGYDNAAAGVKLFRKPAPAPAGEPDFRGRDGCVAPCEPVGRAGLGDPTNTRLLDARAIRHGADEQVWATVGGGVGGVRVYRVSE